MLAFYVDWMEKMLLHEIASLDISRCIVRPDTSETQEREFVLDRRLRPIMTSKSEGRILINRKLIVWLFERRARMKAVRKENECWWAQ